MMEETTARDTDILLLSDLEELRAAIAAGDHDRLVGGICAGIRGVRGAARFRDIAETWPPFSGDRAAPVPWCGGVSPMAAYKIAFAGGGLWEGEYGKRRRELLDYVINYLEDELAP